MRRRMGMKLKYISKDNFDKIFRIILLNNNMASYIFDTELLSAAKTGNPPLTDTTLSAYGIRVVSLSTDDVGIAFNRQSTLNSVLSTITIQGSVFYIDTAYLRETVAVIKTDNTFSIVLSAANNATAIPNSTATVENVSTVNRRRLWHMGYI